MNAETAADLLAAMRRNRPLVHNITNYVAMDITANGLLAVGASPAMVSAVEEASEFVAVADALVVNIGTLSPPSFAAMQRAAVHAVDLGKPWVLDPVAVGATRYRTEAANDLAGRRPTVIRGNASEILALAGGSDGTRGVDATHGSDQARSAASGLARITGAVVAVTGSVDYVTDGRREAAVENGHPLMTRVTAVGCLASALVGAFLPSTDDALAATVAALTVLGVVGERAAAAAEGPGSFRVRLIDELYRIDPDAIRRDARIG